MTDTIEIYKSSVLSGISHGFLGRQGGVSTGIYKSLNIGLGTQDSRDHISENRKRAVEAVAPHATLVTLRQVHSAKAVFVEKAVPDDQRVEADAMVTHQPHLALGILTADCVPVLFADTVSGLIGAAHAGWKGAVAGVTDATIDLMVEKGALRHNIVAAIGPAIQQASYEVDDGFYQRFVADNLGNQAFFLKGRDEHWQFDLPAYVEKRLKKAGLGMISRSSLDTCQNSEQFFSYRRACLAGEADYGRQISIIAL
ncbi:MAG: peptidoglycan editing factor PgeF [Zymomonas mobilis]|uniref:peptidoglycan editing factor PgeF n=1 Tax=Zymomonas mobilis TaxID=542 RepID=UPI0039E9DF98